SGTAIRAAMFRELLAHGRRATGVRLDRSHSGGRRRWRLAENSLHHARTAKHRGGGGSVRSDLENACLGQKSAARAVRWQFRLPDLLTGHTRDLVMLGKTSV